MLWIGDWGLFREDVLGCQGKQIIGGIKLKAAFAKITKTHGA